MKKAKYMLLGKDLDGNLCGHPQEGYIFSVQGTPMGVTKGTNGKWRLTHLPSGMGINQIAGTGYDTRKQAAEWYDDPEHLAKLQRLLKNLPKNYYDVINRAYVLAEPREDYRPAMEMINGTWEY